jgi:two-component system, NtrC family, nitrogen regulation response regulator GlnG
MADDVDEGAETAQLRLLTRALADAVPSIVQNLMAAGRGRGLHREVMILLERPLVMHVLAMTGGNQLRAARVLGLNRNTLRKRCRELRLSLPRDSRAAATSPAQP